MLTICLCQTKSLLLNSKQPLSCKRRTSPIKMTRSIPSAIFRATIRTVYFAELGVFLGVCVLAIILIDLFGLNIASDEESRDTEKKQLQNEIDILFGMVRERRKRLEDFERV